MSESYFDNLMPVAFAGMKADMGFDRVETYPSAAAIPFGVVVGRTNVPTDTVPISRGGVKAIGIALHSHAVTGNGYPAKTPVSVMTRGMVWALAHASDGTTATTDTVRYDDDGLINHNGAHTLPNARGRHIRIVNGQRLVLVELHAPTA